MSLRATRLILALTALLSLLGSTLFLVPVARAANFVVANTNDSGVGSLRQAILDAAASPGADTIGFQAGVTGTITLLTTLTVNQDVTITGPGTGVITIRDTTNCCFDGPLFTVTGGTVAISGVKIIGESYDNGAITLTGGNLALSALLITQLTGKGIVTTGGVLAVSASTLSDNSNHDLDLTDTTATLTNVTVSGGGRGIRALRSTVTLNTSTVTGNQSSDGRGIYADTSTINLNGSAVTNNGTDLGWTGGGIYGTKSNVTLSGSTLSGNKSSNGGGIYLENTSTLTISDSTISGNTADSTGGVRTGTGTLNISNSTISGNTAASNYGGLRVVSTNATITGTTISGNKAGGSVGGAEIIDATLVMTNSTVSGNTANVNVGGIQFWGSLNDATLRFVTLTGNVADFDNDGSGNAGGFYRQAGILNFLSSIIAGNIDKGGEYPDCDGSYTSQGSNLFGATLCPLSSTDAAVTDINTVLNATLANNGGPTLTHALVANSPAVGGGPTTCPGGCPTVDQRGIARPQGARSDIGAYEAEGGLANPAVTRGLTVSSNGNGTISVQPAPNAAGARYIDGTLVTLRATATGSAAFTGWTVDGAAAGSANPLNLTMDRDHTVVANFGTPSPSPSPSPSAPPPTFSDVPPGSFGYTEIGKLAQRGITTGCGPGEFCPNRPITRAEMAAFIIRTVTGTTTAPAGPATPTFTDVPANHPQYGFIEALVARGITTGCGGNEYCPDRKVTRAEMAAFIIRALTNQTAAPAGPPTPTFSDVPTTQAQYGFIEALVARRVTTGCGGTEYCPNREVTRAEMAVFIIRAYP